MQKAIIIGASSGIGHTLTHTLASKGYQMGLVARRHELLLSLQLELSSPSFIKQVDVTQPEAMSQVQQLIDEMGGVDLFIVNAGIYHPNRAFDWEKEKETIDINVTGFAAMAHLAFTYFLKQGRGHLVGISSVSALRGEKDNPAYSASKAFVSNYLEGLRKKAFWEAKEIAVTDIKPGWVDTVMAKDEKTFWMATPEVAAACIYKAIRAKKEEAYITPRWRLYGWLMKLLPSGLYYRYF
jgi:short-subunit dehydrogenase